MPEDTKPTLTPAEHIDKMLEMARSLQAIGKDLEDSISDFKKNPFHL